MANIVLIREIHTAHAVYFTLKHTASGTIKRWDPPRNLGAEQYDEVLEHIAAKFIAEIEANTTAPLAEPVVDINVPYEEMTLRQFGEWFMAHKEIDIAEYTRSTWHSSLRNRIYPAMGDCLVRNIRPSQIDDFFHDLKAEGLAHSTVIKYYSILNVLFQEASYRDACTVNPMDKVKRPKARKDEHQSVEPASYTADEISYILECAEKEPLRWRVFILIMADTGIRRGECCGLRWNDIDWRNNTIDISSNAGYTAMKGVYVTTTKNTRSRVVDVDPDIMEYIRALQEEELAKHDGDPDAMSPYLFPHRLDPSKPMVPSSATRYFGKFGDRYGVDEMHPHKLRHSYASVAITSGADIASVSEILGHSDKAFTLRVYTSSNLATKRKASDIRRQAIHRAGNT